MSMRQQVILFGCKSLFAAAARAVVVATDHDGAKGSLSRPIIQTPRA